MQAFFRYAKAISLICGFFFTVIGAAWSLLVVDRLGEQMKQLTDTKGALTSQMDTLDKIASEYFIANQQGDLIFILAQNPGARSDVAGLIYQGNILDRETPVRNMIGALAIAKLLDYRQAYDAYEKINSETRANFSFENFTRLKMAEKEIISKGEDYVPVLLTRLTEIDQAINANETAQKRARLIGVISSLLGSFLLLCANLIAEREHFRPNSSPAPSPEKPEDEEGP
jgi:hypothetical protein